MVEEYCRSLLKVAVAQLCQGLGWHAIHTTPCDLLTDVLQRYLEHLARHSHRYAEQYGRTDPNLDDVGLAFSHMQVRLNELETYLKEVEPIPFAHPLPTFPVPKKNNLQIPQPGSRDCRERLEYIPEHMPPLVDIAGEFGEGLDAMDVSHSSRASLDGDSYEPHTPLLSPTSPRGEKRELLSPSTDYFAFKRLRMMEDGNPRELTALSMGVNGEITPKREGRLPVATTPPQKQLLERRGSVTTVPLSRTDSKPDGLLTKVPKSPSSSLGTDTKVSKGKGITPPKPKPKSPKHLFFSPGGTPSVFQVKPKSPAVVIMDKVKELMPSGSKNIKVVGPNIGTLLITTKKNVETPALPAGKNSDDNDKSPSPKKPSALDVYDFEDEDTKPRPSKTFDPCGELPDPSKAVLPSATLIRDEEEEVLASAASIEDTIESVISKMARGGVSSKSSKKNGKDGDRERAKEKGKDKSKDRGKDKSVEKGKGGLLDMANKSNQEKSSGKGHSLPPKLLFKNAWRESEGAITSAIKVGTSPGLAPKLLIKTADPKDKSKDKKDHKLKKSGDEKSSSGKESKKERSKRKKEQLKKEKLKKKKLEKKRRMRELASKAASSSSGEAQADPLKQPTIAKLNIITTNPKSLKVRVVSQSDSPASSPGRDKSSGKLQKDKACLKKKRKEKERKAKIKAAKDSLKKAKQKEGTKNPKKKEEGAQNPSEEPPEKVAKLTVPKLMLKIGSASSSGETTKIIIKKQPEKPKPPPLRVRTPSPSSSSSSSSPSPSPSPPPRRKSPSPSPPPRSPSPSPCPSPSPVSPVPTNPPPKKTPAAKKAPPSKRASHQKKAPAASPPGSPPLVPAKPHSVPKSPPSPPRSPPPPKVAVTVPPVRKAASKAFSAIAKPTKVAQPVSPGAAQPQAPFKGISVPTKASLKAPVEKPSTSKGSKASQKAPATPPPSGGTAQRSVILETVGTVMSDTGEKIWICPNCKLPDDGSAMIGCDTCDDWYHWPCVGIKEEPKEDNWYCPRCRVPKKKKGKKKYR